MSYIIFQAPVIVTKVSAQSKIKHETRALRYNLQCTGKYIKNISLKFFLLAYNFRFARTSNNNSSRLQF